MRLRIIEWALSAGEIVFHSNVTFAVGGASGPFPLSGREVPQFQAHQARSGDVLTVGPPESGRFRYIAVADGFDCPLTMGSRSTYTPGGFGGINGRRLKSGDSIAVGSQRRKQRHHVSDGLPQDLLPPVGQEPIRFVARGDCDIARDWKVSAASDRTGYRLESDSSVDGGSVTSEPVCPGVIQLPPAGQPIVLMADAPTIGGYRIAGAVISTDLGKLAQRNPGALVTFEAVTIGEAHRATEREAARIESIREWSLG